MNIANIASYKFVDLSEEMLKDFKASLKEKAVSLAIKGTILLSLEGINIMLAGLAENIKLFQTHLSEISAFADLQYKTSYSEFIPFKRMLVKIKKETITFKVPDIKPNQFTAPYISPQALRELYQQGTEMLVIDTRNDYEIEHGKFAHAVDVGLDSFTEFPHKVAQYLANENAEKTIVTYCTGGIRCEKAATHLMNMGFKNVYQLEGGILNYFAECGREFYEGRCFVFDERVAI